MAKSRTRQEQDPGTWDSIHAVRKVGNIGVHMEKDVNLIIEVDDNEAELLVGLIETLFADWYVVREKRKERNEAIKRMAEKKATPDPTPKA